MCFLFPFTLSNVFYCCNYDRQGEFRQRYFVPSTLLGTQVTCFRGLPNLEVLAHPTPAEPIEERHRKIERWRSAYTYLPDACEPSAVGRRNVN
jgi:hypothetical protein